MTEKTPLTIAVKDYAVREAGKEIAPLGLSDTKAFNQRLTPAYERIRDQTGKQIMAGSLTAYTMENGKPQPASNDHRLIRQLAAWLDGKRSEKKVDYNLNSGGFTRAAPREWTATINNEWINGLHIEDIDLAADLAAARMRITELEARLADLETGGITVEGREAPELDAAISLYRAVATKDLPEDKTAAQALADKADTFCQGMTEETKKRIATVCNWDKTTGRKKK